MLDDDEKTDSDDGKMGAKNKDKGEPNLTFPRLRAQSKADVRGAPYLAWHKSKQTSGVVAPQAYAKPEKTNVLTAVLTAMVYGRMV